jgi:N-acyl-phosphatidylethanolamine-hydrolysing phospholipase D
MAEDKQRLPAHHLPNGKGFINPWPSCDDRSAWDFLSTIVTQWNFKRSRPPVDDQKVPVRKPDFTVLNTPLMSSADTKGRVTWLGHACFLVQVGSVNILTDPVFSHRCSPSQLVGPARITKPPCELSELPRIDMIIISHNHYDHLDVETINTLFKLNPGVKFYVPLGNKNWFTGLGISGDSVEEMDWWQESSYSKDGKTYKIACTPCQHFSSRTAFDRDMTLWASWVVQAEENFSFYFAGDTGYCTVPKELGDLNPHDRSKVKEELPVCPAFKEIGEKYGPFDLACIPIGAYSPRYVMSRVHCSPEDAVALHVDIKSKFSVGMHWGTWILTDEDPTEPPKKMKAEMSRLGLPENQFVVFDIGETRDVPK